MMNLQFQIQGLVEDMIQLAFKKDFYTVFPSLIHIKKGQSSS